MRAVSRARAQPATNDVDLRSASPTRGEAVPGRRPSLGRCANLDRRAPVALADLNAPHQVSRGEQMGPAILGAHGGQRDFSLRQPRTVERGQLAGLLPLCLVVWGCASATLTAVDGGPNPDAGPDGGNVAVILTV